jgi:hypothetical protein
MARGELGDLIIDMSESAANAIRQYFARTGLAVFSKRAKRIRSARKYRELDDAQTNVEA